MFFEFRWNNFLHYQVANMISIILSDENNKIADLLKDDDAFLPAITPGETELNHVSNTNSTLIYHVNYQLF